MTEQQFAVLFYGIMFATSGFAFIYGVVHYFKKKAALYAQLVTCSMGCFAMSYLFEMVLILVNDEVFTGFQVGNFGLIGGMAFLFSSSFGQMDGLVDDRTKTYRKYRLIALLAPFVVLVLYLPSLFASTAIETKIVTLVQFLFICPAAYYNLKHAIIRDVDLGIIKSVRGYNITALILELCITLELVAINIQSSVMMVLFAIAISALFVILIPMLQHGMKKWTL